MSETTLVATARSEFGKGAARRIRRAGNVPAVMYGHGTDPVHITLPGHDTMMALKHANALLAIDLDGTVQLALAKDIQRDPVRPVIEHVDLVIVRKGEKVQVEVPVVTEGEAVGGAVVTVESQTLLLEVEATSIPEHVVVSIEGVELGTQIHASDLTLPEGAVLVDDADTLVVNVAAPVAEDLGGEEIVYLGDTARYPYGPRPQAEVREFAHQIATELIEEQGAKLLIVACNTAAAAALSELQEHFDIPVVGVIEPGVRSMAAATCCGVSGAAAAACISATTPASRPVMRPPRKPAPRVTEMAPPTNPGAIPGRPARA